MKRRAKGIYGVLLLLGMLGSCYLAVVRTQLKQVSSRQVGQQAVLVLERDKWDFGAVGSGVELQAAFPIRNVGNRRLIIHQVAECDCDEDDPHTVVLAPGESAKLLLTADTFGLTGAYRVQSTYTTSAKNLPKFTLTLSADVRRDSPSTLSK